MRAAVESGRQRRNRLRTFLIGSMTILVFGAVDTLITLAFPDRAYAIAALLAAGYASVLVATLRRPVVSRPLPLRDPRIPMPDANEKAAI